MAAVAENLLAAAKFTAKLAADCATYLGRVSLDLVQGGRTLWLRRQRGKHPERASSIDSQIESIRTGRQARWNDFRALPLPRKALVHGTSWVGVLLACYVLVLPDSRPSDPSDSDNPAGSREVYVWEGDIHVEKKYSGRNGTINWVADYHVRLKEICVSADAEFCYLQPLELKYSIQPHEALDTGAYVDMGDRHAFGPGPHNRSISGRASDLLRAGENAPEEHIFGSIVGGKVYKGRQAPGSPDSPPRGDSEAEQFWDSCMDGVPKVTGQPAYHIHVDMLQNAGGNDTADPHPLLRGIQHSGPDLQEAYRRPDHRAMHVIEVVKFWLCGRMKSPDDSMLKGEHAFTRTTKYITWDHINELPPEPHSILIRWELEREEVELEEAPESTSGSSQALEPADLALKVLSAPDRTQVGERINYRFEIENKGPADAHDVVVSIDAGGAQLVDADASEGECRSTSSAILCKLGVLEEDDDASVTLGAIPRVAGVLSNTARIHSASPDPDMSNNEENVAVRVAAQK